MPKNLTVRVLLAILLGIVVGYFFPAIGVELKFLSDIFIRLVKMLIAPIVFLTISVGMAHMGNLKKVGVLGAKALVYFELVTTLALAIGVGVASIVQPGRGFDTSHAHTAPETTISAAQPFHWVDFIMHCIPDSAVGALAKGDMLPVLVFAVLFGAALAQHADEMQSFIATMQRLCDLFFAIIGFVMKLSPLAALGAIAYSVGAFGVESLWTLGKLMLTVYVTMTLFIGGVLAAIARAFKFRILRLLKYIWDELVLVLGTSSSESVLPAIMEKLEKAGCGRDVVRLVVPAGYSFNLDGTSIYLSIATLFIAQAYGVHLSFEQLAFTLGVLMLTSKGAAGVTGSGLVTLAATLASLPGHAVPPEGVALVIGVDRFMSEARAITNLIGNSVATVVLAKAQGEFDDAGHI